MKDPQKSLAEWTEQAWRTSTGKPSLKGGGRYLPDAAWKALSPAEKAATNRAKRKGMRAGQGLGGGHFEALGRAQDRLLQLGEGAEKAMAEALAQIGQVVAQSAQASQLAAQAALQSSATIAQASEHMGAVLRAMAAPMPRLAPLTSAILPESVGLVLSRFAGNLKLSCPRCLTVNGLTF